METTEQEDDNPLSGYTEEELEFLRDMEDLGGPPLPRPEPEEQQKAQEPIEMEEKRSFLGLKPMPTLPAPRNYDSLTRENRMVMDTRDSFTGFKFNFTRAVSREFQLSHSLGWASEESRDNGYGFGAVYSKRGAFFQARYQPSLSVVSGASNIIWGNTKFGFMGTSSTGAAGAPPTQFGFDVNYRGRGRGLVCGARYHTISGLDLSYVQSITKGITAGLQGTLGLSHGSRLDGALRIEAPLESGRKGANTNCILTANGWWSTMAGQEYTLSYAQQKVRRSRLVQSSKTWATMLQFIKPVQEDWKPLFALGYNYDVAPASIKVRLDTDWKLHAVYEERVSENFAVSVCSTMDYYHEKYTFGCTVAVAL